MKGMIEKINYLNRMDANKTLSAFGEANGLDVNAQGVLKQKYEDTFEYVNSWFTGKDIDGRPTANKALPMSEAVTSTDFPLLMKRVISDQMMMPAEPEFFLMNSVAKKIDFGFDYPLYTEFPGIVGVMADVVPENGQYPDVTPAMQANKFSVKLRKFGLRMNVSEEVQKHSVYPLIALFMKIGKAGIERKAEEQLSIRMKADAHVVFNNSSSDSTLYTSGLATDQSANYSFSYNDLFFMMQALVANRYRGSHLLVHPLGYSVLMNDPWIRNIWLHGGQLGQGVWDMAPQENVAAITPFGLEYVPYYNVDFTPIGNVASANVSGNALPACLLTDLYVIDKNNSLVFAHAGGIEEDQIDDWFTDSRCIKMRQYMDFGTLDRGFGMMRAKDIRVVRNFEPVTTIRTVE